MSYVTGPNGFRMSLPAFTNGGQFIIENKDDWKAGNLRWLARQSRLESEKSRAPLQIASPKEGIIQTLLSWGNITSVDEADGKQAAWIAEIESARLAVASNSATKLTDDSAAAALSELNEIKHSIDALAAFRAQIFESPEMSIYGLLGYQIQGPVTVEQSPFAFIFSVSPRDFRVILNAQECKERTVFGLTLYNHCLPSELRGKITIFCNRR